MQTAFALAGLGGFNAHGAGFLQAARDNDYWPDLVTATSGQILVLADYLAGEPDLRRGLIDRNLARSPAAQLNIAWFGYPGVFAPAYGAALSRFFTPPALGDSLVDVVADRLLPAQQYVPSRPSHVIDGVAATLNDSRLGVVFNAYDPTSGQGVLFGNDVARRLLPTESAIPVPIGRRGKDARYAPAAETRLRPITPESIRSALWLSLYGFEQLPGGLMDGAYHRPCILSELHGFDRVIVARPLANGWLHAKLPRNWFDVQDWQCEMWFSAGYKAEVDTMKRINQLVASGVITDPKFRVVDLREVEPPTPAGYFNYFVERESVFEAARAEADALFKHLDLVTARVPPDSAGCGSR